MIFLAFPIASLVLAAVFLPPALLHHDAEGKNTWWSALTMLHSLAYLGISVYLVTAVTLPFTWLRDYLFVDRLSGYEAVISALVFFLASVYGYGYVKSLLRAKELRGGLLSLYYICFNLLMMAIVFCFFADNLALFWILLELTTLFSAVLVVTLGERDNIVAALKYIFIASTAMLFSVVGLIILYTLTRGSDGGGTLVWHEVFALAGTLPASGFVLAFTLVFIGFAAKAGIVPFHTWLPPAHAKAPSVVSAVLSGVLLNCGLYGVLRMYAIAAKTPAAHTVSVIIIVFGAISVAVAAFSLLPRNNIKKLTAFSSIENMGLLLVGVGIGTGTALYWTLFQMLLHSLIKPLLFFSAGILHRQYRSNDMPVMHDGFRLQPLASWGLVAGTIAILGIPPSPLFISKLFLLVEATGYSPVLLFILLVLFLVVAGAFAYLLIPVLTRHSAEDTEPYRTHWTMRLPIVLLFVLILGAGVSLYAGLGNFLNDIVNGLGW
jgi:hydrogenase-4 component F